MRKYAMKNEKFSLKNQLFNPIKVAKIANEIHIVFPDFIVNDFIEEVVSKFPVLELKQRIQHLAFCLKNHLPKCYCEALNVLLKSLPEPLSPKRADNDFGDFIYAAYSAFVAQFGCTAQSVQLSLHALEEITQRFSAEYAIRVFINAFPEETFNAMQNWQSHPNYHVRRLVSEGTRPRLPWGIKTNYDLKNTETLLDVLHSDKTRFVTRSVSNHLNDVSKSNPDFVIQKLTYWKMQQKQDSKELDFIVRHALRTLIKAGNKKALAFIGMSIQPKVYIENMQISSSVQMNNYLDFSFTVKALESCLLTIDYVLHFQNSSKQMKSKKVFKIKQIELKKKESISVHKRHQMKQFMSTKTLYAGRHAWSLQINGDIVKHDEFDLV